MSQVSIILKRNMIATNMLLDWLIYVFYLSNGLIPNVEYQNYEIFTFILVLINDVVLIGGLSMAFWNATNIMYKSQIGAALCGIFYQLWFKVLARSNKTHILNITDTLRENSKFGMTDFSTKTYRKLKRKFLPLMALTLLFITIGFSVTFSRFLIDLKIDLNDPDIYVVPFLFKFWSIDSFGEYLTILSLQIIFFLPEILAYMSTILYVCFVLANLEVHVEEIGTFVNYNFAPKHILVNTMRRYNRNEKIELHRKIKQLIMFEQRFRRYLNDVIGLGKLIFNSMLSVVIFSFILLVLSIQVAADLLARLKIISVVVTFMLVYFILCYTGETVSRMNHTIQTTFYDAPWYSFTPDLRRYFIMSMIQRNSELQVKLMDMYTINLDFYANTMKIVYSATNFIMLNHKLS